MKELEFYARLSLDEIFNTLHNYILCCREKEQNDFVNRIIDLGNDGDYSLEMKYLKALREQLKIDFSPKVVECCDKLIQAMKDDNWEDI
jgi:hypothetical protein